MPTFRIVSRKSALALWQAHFVKAQLEALYPEITATVIGISTSGDKLLDISLSKIGGKGLFVKELEEYLLAHKADIAVHSMKDMPVSSVKELKITAILKRGDSTDAFISPHYAQIQDLPIGAKIGTSSLRRQSQLRHFRSDLQIEMLRGNVETRLKKLEAGQFDAIVLATAGLKRLGLEHYIRHTLEALMLPAVGQGAMGVQCRANDLNVQDLMKPLNDEETAYAILAERSMNATLAGSCQAPVAGFAQIENKLLILKGLVGQPDGSRIIEAQDSAEISEAYELGKRVGQWLLAKGAAEIIQALK